MQANPYSNAFRQISCIDGKYVAKQELLTLSSAFQPIVSLNHRRTVGYEALIRVKDARGRSVAPLDLFAESLNEPDTISLDRLCRDRKSVV